MKTLDSFDNHIEFKGPARTWSLIFIAIGVVGIAYGFLSGTNTERTFANLLLMGYYFTCVCICGIFFCAVQYVAQAGWSASIIRIPQAFARILPYAATILFIIICAGLFVTHTGVNEEGKKTVMPYLYKLWALDGVATKGTPNYDSVIAAKAGYLNIKFFLTRIIFYLVSYSVLGWLLVKYSNNEDELGGMHNYNKSFKISVLFLLIFGFTVPLFAFDTIMSIDAHWFSTMFGWYNFAALWVSGLSTITLVIIFLKQKGHLEWITTDHLHNFGQLIFGFSIFWTYLWFSQFLLTWYANLPEEAAYFYKRWEPEFKPWFWLNIVINFVTPLFVLMSRDSKRMMKVLKVVCIILICGHWLDYWQMIMPGAVGPQSDWFMEIGPIEISIFLGFVGLFIAAVLTSLSRFKSLAPVNHPFLQESLHHHI
jgi:hypothetical protein